MAARVEPTQGALFLTICVDTALLWAALGCSQMPGCGTVR